MTRLLVVNHELLSERMTGPTIRNWEICRVAGRELSVTLAVPGEGVLEGDGFAVTSYASGGLAALIARHDVVLASGYLLERHPELMAAGHLAVDLYDPFPLENLHMHKEASLEEQHRISTADHAVLTRLIRAGDVFFCASERQRDFWTGWLAASGRVNPYTHDRDPALASLLRLLPFGIDERPPVPATPRFRGRLPGIGPEDLLALWGGGIWNWFDPLTLIRAVDRLKDRLPHLRLVFPAPASPSNEVPPMRMSAEARRLSDDLGLTDRRVYFGAGWVPYSERGGMLLEADIGVSTHQLDVETRYSFRTRILDFLWAGLPILTTEGDSLAELVGDQELGEVVAYGSVEGVAEALLRLSGPGRRRECAARSRAAAAEFTWPRVTRSLLEYCRQPTIAPDREVARTAPGGHPAIGLGEPGRLARLSVATLRREGPAGLIRRAARYAGRNRP